MCQWNLHVCFWNVYLNYERIRATARCHLFISGDRGKGRVENMCISATASASSRWGCAMDPSWIKKAGKKSDAKESLIKGVMSSFRSGDGFPRRGEAGELYSHLGATQVGLHAYWRSWNAFFQFLTQEESFVPIGVGNFVELSITAAKQCIVEGIEGSLSTFW